MHAASSLHLHPGPAAAPPGYFSTDELAQVIAHDFRSPLLVIEGFCRELCRAESREESRVLTERILANAGLLRSRFEAVLRLLRLDQLANQHEEIEVSALARRTLARLAVPADVSIERLPILRGSEGLLSEAFLEVLGNAVKFRSPGTRPVIHISCDEAGPHWVTIVVRDRGVGCSACDSSKPFDMFARLHRDDEFPGLGAGLAIARRAVELLGGSIRMESTPGEGTSVFLRFARDRCVRP